MAFEFKVKFLEIVDMFFMDMFMFLVCVGKSQRPLRLEIFQECYL